MTLSAPFRRIVKFNPKLSSKVKLVAAESFMKFAILSFLTAFRKLSLTLNPRKFCNNRTESPVSKPSVEFTSPTVSNVNSLFELLITLTLRFSSLYTASTLSEVTYVSESEKRGFKFVAPSVLRFVMIGKSKI